MQRKILVITALIILGCSSCKKEGELRGSVFIVSKGAENYKLGLVLVSAIPEDRMQQFIENKKSYIRTQYNNLKTYQDSYKNTFDIAQKNYDDAKKSFDVISSEKSALSIREQELNSNSNPYIISDDEVASEYGTSQQQTEKVKQRKLQQQLQAVKQQIAKYEPLIEDARNKLNAAEKQLSDLKSQALINQQKISNLFSEGALYEDVPESSVKTVTDADGKFILKLPTSGKFAIAAHSDRRVFDSTERYYWLIWTSLNGQDSKQIMLSNQNMIGQDSDDSVFNLKELLPNYAEINKTAL